MSTALVERVARWDVCRLRAAVATMAGVVDRLTGWRLRLESLGREIGREQSWAGPAADRAADAVVDLATAAAAVADGLDRSLGAMHDVTTHASAAQELAAQALAVAAVANVDLDVPLFSAVLRGPGRSMAPEQAEPTAARAVAAQRAVALAREALHERDLVLVRAADAGGALRSLGIRDAFVPATFADLAAGIGLRDPVPAPRLPLGYSPAEVARWWATLSAAAQLAAIDGEPERIGNTDGLPGWARDRANRVLLDRALRDRGSPGHATARVVAARLAAAEATGGVVQLYEFDPERDLVAIALGDCDDAEAVAVLVPGMGTTPEDDLPAMLENAAAVRAAALVAAPGTSTSVIAWLGYRTPGNLLTAASPWPAIAGGVALAGALGGLSAARTATGTPPARTTVLAHSYGTVALRAAAGRPGPLAADAVVLLGSPATGFDGARGLESAEVYAASAPFDLVAHLDWFGIGPTEPGYGATDLPTDLDAGHSDYYDPRHSTVAALGEVVVGTRHPR